MIISEQPAGQIAVVSSDHQTFCPLPFPTPLPTSLPIRKQVEGPTWHGAQGPASRDDAVASPLHQGDCAVVSTSGPNLGPLGAETWESESKPHGPLPPQGGEKQRLLSPAFPREEEWETHSWQRFAAIPKSHAWGGVGGVFRGPHLLRRECGMSGMFPDDILQQFPGVLWAPFSFLLCGPLNALSSLSSQTDDEKDNQNHHPP